MANRPSQLAIRNIMIATFWFGLAFAALVTPTRNRLAPDQLSMLPGFAFACLLTAGWSLFGYHKSGFVVGMAGGLLLGAPLFLIYKEFLISFQTNVWTVFVSLAIFTALVGWVLRKADRTPGKHRDQ
jgi:hypothetical protein